MKIVPIDQDYLDSLGEPLNGDRAGDILSPEFSEDSLALTFVARHADELRYVAAWGKRLVWTGTHWKIENTLAVFDMARKICREAAECADKSNSATRKGTII